jgi:MerR family transcriptional regulator/heat shock protein HspR
MEVRDMSGNEARRDRERLAVYVISVAAELAGVHPQTLRIYERRGLVRPARTQGGNRRYSDADIALLRRILEGIRQVLELENEVARLREEVSTLRAELQRRGGRNEIVPLRQSLGFFARPGGFLDERR